MKRVRHPPIGEEIEPMSRPEVKVSKVSIALPWQPPLRWFAYLCLCLGAGAVSGQQTDLAQAQDIQRDLSILGGILEESLQLNESTGLFGVSLGGVEAMYLYGQGAMLEIRSPLANRRNRMGLASLSTAMEALQRQQNPFETLRLNAATSTQIAGLAGIGESTANGYRQLLDRIASTDYSVVAQSAVQQAARSARALKALGETDAASHAALEQELAALRVAVDEKVQALRKLEQQIRQSGAASDSADADFSAQLEELVQAFAPVKDQALAVADELRERSARAEQQYADAWQQDLETFRQQLYQSVCQYGPTLALIPDTEHLSLVLKGLGAEQPDNRRTDEVHVISKADIRACGKAEIDAATLRQRAIAYTF